MRVDDGQDPQLLAESQLIVNEVHGPDIIWADGFGTVIAKLGLYPPFRGLVPQLKTQGSVNIVDLPDADIPSLRFSTT